MATWIASRAGALLEEMQGSEADQEAFAKLAKKLIGALETDLGEPLILMVMMTVMKLVRMTLKIKMMGKMMKLRAPQVKMIHKVKTANQ